MRILINAATESELSAFTKYIDGKCNEWCTFEGHHIKVVISGIGPVSTTFRLTSELNREKIDLVINAGIAGSFSKKYPVGSVVNVVSEQFSDLGIDDNGEFRSIFALGLENANEFPFREGILHNPDTEFNMFPKVNGITSEMTHGSSAGIERIQKRYNPDVETMEGAAVFFVCLHQKVRFLELRAISNFVEPRDTSKWNIPLAIGNLSEALHKVISSL